jgi:hypothetical protein
LRQFSTGQGCALLCQQVGNIGAKSLGLRCLASRSSLAATVELLGHAQASACKAAQAAVLLLDGLLQHLRPELRQRALNVAASQATSGRGALQ